MRTALLVLLTAVSVGAISWLLLVTGSWLICAGISTAVLAVLLWLESMEQKPDAPPPASAAERRNERA